jgi:hypothetical protein
VIEVRMSAMKPNMMGKSRAQVGEERQLCFDELLRRLTDIDDERREQVSYLLW